MGGRLVGRGPGSGVRHGTSRGRVQPKLIGPRFEPIDREDHPEPVFLDVSPGVLRRLGPFELEPPRIAVERFLEGRHDDTCQARFERSAGRGAGSQLLRRRRAAGPHAPCEVGHFLPPVPEGSARVCSNDVCVDDRGLMYLVDRGRGVHILERA